MTKMPTKILVTGGFGGVGRLLRGALAGQGLGGLPVLWHARRPGPGVDLAWDIGRQDPPALPESALVLHLAGCVAGSQADLADNAASAREVARWVRGRGWLLAMSSAAVYAPAARDLTEDDPPAPPSPYGLAKLQAEQALIQATGGQGLVLLRLANLAGGDVLFGNIRAGLPITLDPIAGQEGGPIRSYIGPVSLAQALSGLVGHLRAGRALPQVLNLAQPGAVAMADVLRAAGANWHFGPPRAAAVPRVTLDVTRLQALVPLAPATATSLVAEVAAATGAQP